MTVTVETEFKAWVKDDAGKIEALVYSPELAKAIEALPEVAAALRAADEAWDSAFSERREAARAKVREALAKVAA